jgi:hypothetical protein
LRLSEGLILHKRVHDADKFAQQAIQLSPAWETPTNKSQGFCGINEAKLANGNTKSQELYGIDVAVYASLRGRPCADSW